MDRGRVESRITREKAAAARAKAAEESSGASGGLTGRVSAVSGEEVMHQLRGFGKLEPVNPWRIFKSGEGPGNSCEKLTWRRSLTSGEGASPSGSGPGSSC